LPVNRHKKKLMRSKLELDKREIAYGIQSRHTARGLRKILRSSIEVG